MGKSYLSFTAAVILQALDNGYQYGFDIMDVTGLPSGTVYAVLRRLETNDYIKGQWEKQAIALKEQRPARKYYELTKAGRALLAEAVARYRLLEQSPLVTSQPKAAE
jgi:PadR family transcriptional regulator